VEANFLKPVRLGENITILTEVLNAGFATLEVKQSIVRLEADHAPSFVDSYNGIRENLIHDCKLHLCCVDLETLRPRRFPEALKQAMEIN
jgi:acyl-CoA thioesterase FadM